MENEEMKKTAKMNEGTRQAGIVDAGNAQAPQENKMGVMPVPKLLFTMSLPMIISMLIQAMYNIVDSIFVAQIDEAALTAVSLAFPVQNLMIAVASGTGVGVNALLSKSLGEKKPERANLAANNSIILIAASCAVFMFAGIFGARAFYTMQTSDAQIVAYGTQYLTIVCGVSVGVFFQMNMERLLQSTGLTFYTMITQGTGAILNIILDPILIFGYFGFPKMGVAGAAAATVIGQIVAMILAVIFNLTKNKEIHLSIKLMRPRAWVVKTIYAVGVPSILMMSIGSIMTFGMNKILLMFSSTATAVFGVYFKLQSFFFMPVFGMNNGVVPIIAYNYGARRKDRIMQTFWLSFGAATAVMLLGIVVFNLIPDKLLLLFSASEDMLAIGVPALHIISISFLFAGPCIVMGSVFQALGSAVYSLISTVCRQLVVLLPVAWILANVAGLGAVWWAFPIAEVASVTVSGAFMVHIYRKKIRALN